MEVRQELDQTIIVLHVLKLYLTKCLNLYLTVDAEHHLRLIHALFGSNDAGVRHLSRRLLLLVR